MKNFKKLLVFSVISLLGFVACSPTSSSENGSVGDSNTISSVSPITSETPSTSITDNSGNNTGTGGLYEEISGNKNEFPQAEIKAFFGFQEDVPAYVADSYEFIAGVDISGYHCFEITSAASDSASVAAYSAICTSAQLEVSEDTENGCFYAESDTYFLVFGIDENLFFLDIYDVNEIATEVTVTNVFPQNEINEYLGFTETVPAYQAAEYEINYGTDMDGLNMIEITSTLSATVSAANYLSICETAGLTVTDEYLSTYGIYLTESANGIYQIQFGDDTDYNVFFLDIFILDSTSGGSSGTEIEGTSTTFPVELINEYLGVSGTIPTFEASEYGYYFGVDDYGDKLAEVYAYESTTASVEAYSTSCEAAQFTVDTSYVEQYDTYVAYNETYWIQYYTYDGFFVVDIYLYY